MSTKNTKRIYSSMKALLAANETWAKRDQTHYAEMKELLAANILHATDHGDCTPLNDFYRRVSQGTKELTRQAVNAINKHFGNDHMVMANTPFMLFDFKTNFGEAGPNKGLPTFFFRKEIRVNGDVILSEKDDKFKELRKGCVTAISAKDEPALAAIIDSDQTTRNNTAVYQPYDWQGNLSRIIKAAAKVHGRPKSDLAALNKLLDVPLDVEALWRDGADPKERLEREAREARERLEAYEKSKREAEKLLAKDGAANINEAAEIVRQPKVANA